MAKLFKKKNSVTVMKNKKDTSLITLAKFVFVNV